MNLLEVFLPPPHSGVVLGERRPGGAAGVRRGIAGGVRSSAGGRQRPAMGCCWWDWSWC